MKTNTITIALLTIALTFAQLKGYAATTNETKADRGIAFSRYTFSDPYRRALTKREIIRLGTEDYKANPEKYKVAEINEAANPSSYPMYTAASITYRQMTPQEFTKKLYNIANDEVDGWNIQSTPVGTFIQGSLAILAATTKHPVAVGANVAAPYVFKLLPDKKAQEMNQDVSVYDNMQRAQFEYMDKHKGTKDDVRGLTVNKMNQLGYEATQMGAFESTYKNNQDVKDAHQFAGMKNQVGKITPEIVLALNKSFGEVNGYIKSEKQKAKIQEDFQMKKMEVMGGIGLLGYALKLSGDPVAANKIFKARDLAGSIMDATVTKAGPLAMANIYVGIAFAASEIFSKSGPSADDIIMQQLAQIMNMIADLRREMHDRFDRVDEQLATILAVEMANHNDTTIQLNTIQADIDSIQVYVKSKLEQIVTKLDENQQAQYEFTRKNCFDRAQYSVSVMDDASIITCLNLFLVKNIHTANSSTHTNEKVGPADEELLPFQYAKSLSAIFFAMDDVTKNEIAGNSTSVMFANPQIWLESANDLVSFATLNEKNMNLLKESDLDQVINSGYNLQRFYRFLLVDRKGVIREKLLTTLLNQHKAQLTEIYKFADANRVVELDGSTIKMAKEKLDAEKEAAKAAKKPIPANTVETHFLLPAGNHNEIVNQYKVNALTLPENKQNIRWCEEKNNFKTLVKDINDGSNKNNEENLRDYLAIYKTGDIVAAKFGKLPALALPPEFNSVVDSELRSHELAKLINVEFCINDYIVSVLSATERAPYTGSKIKVDVTLYARTKLVSPNADPKAKPVYKNLRSFSVENVIDLQTPAVAHAIASEKFHTTAWRGLAKSTITPIFNLLKEPSKVVVKNLLLAEDDSKYKAEFKEYLSQVRSRAFKKLNSMSDYRAIVQSAQSTRNLIDAIITVGLIPHLPKAAKISFNSIYNSPNALVRPDSVASLAFDDSSRLENYTSQLDKVVGQLTNKVIAYNEVKIDPIKNQIIRQQLAELKNLRSKLQKTTQTQPIAAAM